MCSRDFRAARCTWLMYFTPVRSRTVPICPLRTPSSSACPGVPFAPEGPAISSCPNFSASVIFPISPLTWLAIDASRRLVALSAARSAVSDAPPELLPGAGRRQPRARRSRAGRRDHRQRQGSGQRGRSDRGMCNTRTPQGTAHRPDLPRPVRRRATCPPAASEMTANCPGLASQTPLNRCYSVCRTVEVLVRAAQQARPSAGYGDGQPGQGEQQQVDAAQDVHEAARQRAAVQRGA